MAMRARRGLTSAAACCISPTMPCSPSAITRRCTDARPDRHDGTLKRLGLQWKKHPSSAYDEPPRRHWVRHHQHVGRPPSARTWQIGPRPRSPWGSGRRVWLIPHRRPASVAGRIAGRLRSVPRHRCQAHNGRSDPRSHRRRSGERLPPLTAGAAPPRAHRAR